MGYIYRPTAPSFCSGTSVLTAEGMVPVDWLRPGDRLLTRDHGFQPLLWVGRSAPGADNTDDAYTVIIAAGALGGGLPTAPLQLSPRTQVLMGGQQMQLLFGHDAMFCAAVFLNHFPGVTRAEGTSPPTYRLLLPRHEAILAEGVWSETLFLGDPTAGTVDPELQEGAATLADLAEGDHRHTAYPCLKQWEAALLAPPRDRGMALAPTSSPTVALQRANG